ncbi:hypothetical protein [Flavihumibacter profundi]|jgi:hypothetical protein|uniref:hypothetical protein n=1 Tax=Flavihumibacter profundi TaxID=2716883 RepID=UPI001CC7E8FC|nr:hypothetical protein [Flavihumibacter profundi]MBZ5858556.1 hypothetical protein [Flavihumibacter profundi]
MITKKIRLIIFWVIISAGVFFLLCSIIVDILLKSKGECKMAILTNEKNRIRSQKSTLFYEFYIQNRKYKGNSLEEDLTRVGDSICVVYIKIFPGINRPIKYFKQDEIKCNCGK